MILAVTGLQRERRIVTGPDVEAVAGGGDHARLEAVVNQLAARSRGVLSIGIAGGLAPGLRAGRWVIADAVLVDGEPTPTDAAWTDLEALAGGPLEEGGALPNNLGRFNDQ